MPIPVPPLAGTGGLTARTLVEETRIMLLAGRKGLRNTLAVPYIAGSRSVTLTYDTGNIQAGSTVSVGLNDLYVWQVDQQSKTLTVSGGENGGRDIGASAGSIVEVDPKFSTARIFTALNNDLRDLSSPLTGLFRVGTVDLTLLGNRAGYDLTAATGLLDIIEVRASNQLATDFQTWPRLHGWRLERNQTSGFPSGMSLTVYDGQAAQTARVLYKGEFIQFENLDTAVADTGLPASAYDLLPLGAAIRLMASREIPRNFTESQGDTRRPGEVPPGSVNASYRGLMLLRQQRIEAEAARLAKMYPA